MMKIRLLVAAAVCAASLCLPALAACSQDTYIEYTLYNSEDEAVETLRVAPDPYSAEETEQDVQTPDIGEGSYFIVTGFSGKPSDVVIPAQLYGAPVRGVAEQAFIQCRYLQSVTIEEGVEYTGGAAFAFCRALAQASLPSTLDTAYSTFAYCTALKTVTMAEGFAAVGDRDFYACSALESVNGTAESAINLPSTLTAIEQNAFYGCSSLAGGLTVPAGVTEIEGTVFAACSGITSVRLLGEVTSIGYASFSGCSAMTEITLPDSVTSVGDGAFSYCTSLESIALPAGVGFLGASAFEGSSVSSVSVPAGKGAWLYTQKLAEDDPETEENEAVLPGTDGAEEWLFDYSYNDEYSSRGYLPSAELADGARAAEYLKGDCLAAYWYFVTPQ